MFWDIEKIVNDFGSSWWLNEVFVNWLNNFMHAQGYSKNTIKKTYGECSYCGLICKGYSLAHKWICVKQTLSTFKNCNKRQDAS